MKEFKTFKRLPYGCYIYKLPEFNQKLLAPPTGWKWHMAAARYGTAWPPASELHSYKVNKV